MFTGANSKPDGDVIHWPRADVKRVKQAENFACPFSAPYFLPFFTRGPDSWASLLLPPLLLGVGGGGLEHQGSNKKHWQRRLTGSELLVCGGQTCMHA